MGPFAAVWKKKTAQANRSAGTPDLPGNWQVEPALSKRDDTLLGDISTKTPLVRNLA